MAILESHIEFGYPIGGVDNYPVAIPVRIIRNLGYSARKADNVEKESAEVLTGDFDADDEASAFDRTLAEYLGYDTRAFPVRAYDDDMSDLHSSMEQAVLDRWNPPTVIRTPREFEGRVCAPYPDYY